MRVLKLVLALLLFTLPLLLTACQGAESTETEATIVITPAVMNFSATQMAAQWELVQPPSIPGGCIQPQTGVQGEPLTEWEPWDGSRRMYTAKTTGNQFWLELKQEGDWYTVYSGQVDGIAEPAKRLSGVIMPFFFGGVISDDGLQLHVSGPVYTWICAVGVVYIDEEFAEQTQTLSMPEP